MTNLIYKYYILFDMRQLSVIFSDELFKRLSRYARAKGYVTISEAIRDIVRKYLEENFKEGDVDE